MKDAGTTQSGTL